MLRQSKVRWYKAKVSGLTGRSIVDIKHPITLEARTSFQGEKLAVRSALNG